jgi:hypothetical protein
MVMRWKNTTNSITIKNTANSTPLEFSQFKVLLKFNLKDGHEGKNTTNSITIKNISHSTPLEFPQFKVLLKFNLKDGSEVGEHSSRVGETIKTDGYNKSY